MTTTTVYFATLADARAYQASTLAPVRIRCLRGDALDGFWEVAPLA